ncbi:MAG: hypothetical protein AAFP90_01705 [Planctomycetota bacterium]
MKVKCPACSTVLQIAPEMAGQVVECKCGQKMRAPGQPVAGPTGVDAAGGNPSAPVNRAASQNPYAAPPNPHAANTAASNALDDGLSELTASDMNPAQNNPYGTQNQNAYGGDQGRTQSANDALAAHYAAAGAAPPASSGGSSPLNGQTGLGLLMMIGSVVWFFGGLMAGIIFFYPPILFIIGIVTLVKGLLGGSD